MECVVRGTVFLDEQPRIERYRGDLFKVTDPNTDIEWVLDAPALKELIATFACAYREFRTETTAQVIPFPAPVSVA